MSWTVRLVAVIVAVAALAGAGSALADANQHFSAKVRVLAHSDQFDYHGRVRSNLEACEVGRKVKIASRGVKLGYATTDASGRFSRLDDPVDDGAIVKFKLIANGSDCPALKLTVEI
ncbi:MAG: hypothetical protein QOI10_930 [Solirubrobacterales bacterium]|nr:hypothetical protein [Solirubrobacterales bacterium]